MNDLQLLSAPRTLDTATPLNNYIDAVQSDRSIGIAQQLARGKVAMQPLEAQQLQAQTGLIGAQTTQARAGAGLTSAETANQQAQLVTTQWQHMNEVSQQRMKSNIVMATMIKPYMDNGDTNSAAAILDHMSQDTILGPDAKNALQMLKGGGAAALKSQVDGLATAGAQLGIIPNQNQVVPQGGSVVDRSGKTVNADPGNTTAAGSDLWNVPTPGSTTPAGMLSPAPVPASAPAIGPGGAAPPAAPPTGAPPAASPPDLAPAPPIQGENQVSPTEQLPLTSDTPAVISSKFPGPHGDVLLHMLNPGVAAQVQAYSEGRLTFPTAQSERTPLMRQIVNLAMQYNPGMDASTFTTRQAMRESLAKGGFGDNVNALNTGMNHMNTFVDAYATLKNGDYPTYNTAANWAGDKFGDTDIQRALGATDTASTALSGEMAKVFKSNGATDQEISAWNPKFNTEAPPAEVAGTLATGTDLLDGRMSTLATQYNRTMGTNITGWQLLSPKAQQAYLAVKAKLPTLNASGNTAAPKGITATNTMGHKVISMDGGKTWKPVQ